MAGRRYSGSIAALIAVPWIATLASCRQVSDEDDMAHVWPPRYVGSDPIAVGGARPGETVAELSARLGAPQETFGSGRSVVLRWRGGATTAVGGDTRISEVTGDQVTAGKVSLLGRGDSRAKAEHVLGPATASQPHWGSGSYLIDLIPRYIGATLTWRRDGSTLEVTFDGADRMKWARMR